MLKSTERETLEEIRLAHEPEIRLGNTVLRPARRALTVEGQDRPLEPRVAQLLVALARRPGTVLSRDDLVDLCWGGRIVGEDAVNRCVAKARRATAGTEVRIDTIPRVGYRLVTRTRSMGYRAWLVILIGVTLLIGGLMISRWQGRQPQARPEYPLVAIGQFRTGSTQAELRERAGEIEPTVIDALADAGVPTVRAGTPGAAKARYILQGQVSAEGDAAYAIVQMVESGTRITVLSQQLDLDRDELPSIAAKVAAAAADAVTRSGVYYALTSKSSDPAETAAFMDVALQIADGNHLEAELRARKLYESRPKSALAPFALSYASFYALPLHPLEERPEVLARARRAAAIARQRLPTFGDVYMAQCNLYPRDYAACEKNAREGLGIDPSAPTLRSQLALLLMDAGRLREAYPLVGASLAETPFNPSKVVHNLYVDQLLGLKTEERYTWAFAQRYWPKLRFTRQRFASLMAAGRWQEAETILPLFLRVEPGSDTKMRILFTALHSPTNANKAKAEAACREELESGASVVCFTTLSMLGRTQAAMDIASRFYPENMGATAAERDAQFLRDITAPRPLFMIWGEGARAMRRDPAFAAFVSKRGLVDFWKSNGPPDACKRDPAPFCKLI